jgi:hypothetical protein
MFKFVLICILLGAFNVEFLQGAKLKQYVVDDKYSRDHFKILAKKLGKKHELEVIITGTGKIIDSLKATWSVSLIGRQALTLDEVRPIITEFAQSLYQLASTDPRFLDKMNGMYAVEHKPSIPAITPDMIGIKITFWDKNVDRVKQPAVAQVIFTDNKITYLFADPKTDALVNPTVEELIL